MILLSSFDPFEMLFQTFGCQFMLINRYINLTFENQLYSERNTNFNDINFREKYKILFSLA